MKDRLGWLCEHFDVEIDRAWLVVGGDPEIRRDRAELTIIVRGETETKMREIAFFIGDQIMTSLRSVPPDMSLHYKWDPREVSVVRQRRY